jgi:effector-binding domain-containing protein
MEKKKVEKITVIGYSLTTTLNTIADDTSPYSMAIMEKAEELGLEISGPQIWCYKGIDGKPDTRFSLNICVPVKEAIGDAGIFKFEELPAMNCLSEIHKGPWSELGNTYQRMFGEMSRKGMIPAGSNREVYLNCDFGDQQNNITELQVELM